MHFQKDDVISDNFYLGPNSLRIKSYDLWSEDPLVPEIRVIGSHLKVGSYKENLRISRYRFLHQGTRLSTDRKNTK